MAKETKLASGALGTAESILMGVSGTAPGFSAAATTARKRTIKRRPSLPRCGT